ncbi:unnamed protein product, partial [Protopolystoma xenopodis]
ATEVVKVTKTIDLEENSNNVQLCTSFHSDIIATEKPIVLCDKTATVGISLDTSPDQPNTASKSRASTLFTELALPEVLPPLKAIINRSKTHFESQESQPSISNSSQSNAMGRQEWLLHRQQLEAEMREKRLKQYAERLDEAGQNPDLEEIDEEVEIQGRAKDKQSGDLDKEWSPGGSDEDSFSEEESSGSEDTSTSYHTDTCEDRNDGDEEMDGEEETDEEVGISRLKRPKKLNPFADDEAEEDDADMESDVEPSDKQNKLTKSRIPLLTQESRDKTSVDEFKENNNEPDLGGLNQLERDSNVGTTSSCSDCESAAEEDRLDGRKRRPSWSMNRIKDSGDVEKKANGLQVSYFTNFG